MAQTYRKPGARRKKSVDPAELLAEAIRGGAYRPGEWLRQIDLEQRLGITRFDVRSGLKHLTLLKLVEHIPNRGYRVSAIDGETARSIREARALIETYAARKACTLLGDATISELGILADRFVQAAEHGTRQEQSDLNQKFHETLYAGSANPVLLDMIWSLRQRSAHASLTVWQSVEALKRSGAEHLAIVAALRRRDIDRVGKLIHQHILKPDAGKRVARVVA